MAFKSFLRIVITVFVITCLFFLVPTPWIYYGLLIIALYFAIVANKWLLVGITLILFAMLIGFAYASGSIDFFLEVYNLIMPNGFNTSWMVTLPQYFFYIIPCCIATMIIVLIFVGSIYRGWADYWLAQTFASYLTYIFFIFTLLNCFFVGITLYAYLSTNTIALFIWEIIFQWVPFFTALFILYYFLGHLFERPTKIRMTSKEAYKRYKQRRQR